MISLFFLPHTPGFDERTLVAAPYSFAHYHHLMYPIYDQPLMIMHPPTKYWLVGLLMSAGVSVRMATAALLIIAYLIAVAGVWAGRKTVLQKSVALFALSATLTLCPFISYRPEDLTHGEMIGRIRPDDLVFVLWFAGLWWLEAGREAKWRIGYVLVGGVCTALAAVTHYSGIPALAALVVYGVAALRASDRTTSLRALVALIGGAVVVLIPFLIVVRPYLRPIFGLVFGQAGEPRQGLAFAWNRHAADLWFLREWMRQHVGNVWSAYALLSPMVATRLPPLLVAAPVLLAFRSSRVLAFGALALPLSVLLVAHQWIGYDLAEIALFFVACGWILGAVCDRLVGRRAPLVGLATIGLALATASPLVANPSALTFMDSTYSPELLRAMGRDVIGPGASLFGGFYTTGEDRCVMDADPNGQTVDYIAEREFHLHAAALHDRYFAGRLRVAGFVFTPGMPSASTVYYTATHSNPLVGFVDFDGRVQRFSTTGSGWRFKMLDCPTTADETLWVAPRPPAPIAGYIPRTDYCVTRTLSALHLGGRYASAFFRRSFPDGTAAPRALVPLLIDDDADRQSSEGIAAQCGCKTVQATEGSLRDVSRDALLARSRASDSPVRFYATAADAAAGITMDQRFFGPAKR